VKTVGNMAAKAAKEAGGRGRAGQSHSLAKNGLPPRRGSGVFNALLQRPLALGLILVAVTVALYLPVHNHPFVNYDDDVYVTVNRHVKSGLSWATAAWALTTFDAANWHPLTWLSHALDCQLFGLEPAGHHDINLLLHAINVALLFWVLLRATGCAGRSFMVAALFALHPINVESVVWIAERKNLLSMLFFLLTLGAWTWYARRPGLGRYLVEAGLFALGLMAKPQVVTLPFVLLLWDYWPLRRMFPSPGADGMFPARSFPSLVKEKLPLLWLSAVSAWLTVKAQRAGGGFNPDYGLLLRIANALICYIRYIARALWPVDLAPMYPHPGAALRSWQAFAALAVLAIISALVIRARQRRYLVVGWLWFLGTLVPMIGLLQVGRQAMADRYAYLPFVGLFIMACWGLGDVAQRRKLSLAWLATAAGGALLALGALTYRQIGYWRDNVTLWAHTAQVTSANYEAEDNWGEALEKAGRADEAVPHFRRAAQISPSYPPAIMFLAVQNQREGKLQEAIQQYRQVIRGTQWAIYQNAAIRAVALANMGHAYRELGNLPEAQASLRSSVELNAGNFAAWMDLGLVSQKLGDAYQAADAYSQAMKLQPSDVGYVLLARALQQSGRNEEAETALRHAKLLSNNYERAQAMAAQLLAH